MGQMTVKQATDLMHCIRESDSDGRRFVLEFLTCGKCGNHVKYDDAGEPMELKMDGSVKWVKKDVNPRSRELALIGIMNLASCLTAEHLAELEMWCVYFLEEQQQAQEDDDQDDEDESGEDD